MTGKLSGQIMETGFLKGVRARVLIALASVSDSHGQSWHSYVSIAHLARCSRKSAIEAIKWMERFELLYIQRGRYLPTKSGKITSATNLYTLHLEFFEALHKMAVIIRKMTPGDAKTKWQAVNSAALWAEDQLCMFQWRHVIEIVNAHPHVIKQTCLGIDPELRNPMHRDGGLV
jgi:hypothetical protein